MGLYQTLKKLQPHPDAEDIMDVVLQTKRYKEGRARFQAQQPKEPLEGGVWVDRPAIYGFMTAWFSLAIVGTPFIGTALLLPVLGLVASCLGVRRTLSGRSAGLTFAVIGLVVSAAAILFRLLGPSFGADFTAHGSNVDPREEFSFTQNNLFSTDLNRQIIGGIFYTAFLAIFIHVCAGLVRKVALYKKRYGFIVAFLPHALFLLLWLYVEIAGRWDSAFPKW